MQKGVTIWLTGLSGAGKSTIAEELEPRLRRMGLELEPLDGDVIRTNLSQGLTFSRTDRDVNVRRIGFVCELLTRHGVIVITSAISPYRAVRTELKERIGNFIEVYVSCPIEECINRDVKGLYKRAIAGEIPQFTGISDPYEEPLNPDIVCHTHLETLDESVSKIVDYLVIKGYIAPVAVEV
ncbi:adenylyl-sulfate kinase [Candidatus Cyanaurora vandensis]|nr:adenylyl-sulfate kinase [Candidatus Cyanaurora vandensis]